MLTRLLKSRRGEATTPIGSIPAGRRLYAIGDIHGRADLLKELLALVAADDEARGPSSFELIFLGDLVDRGPSSASVVETLRQLKERQPNARFLLGNHEEVFLLALSGDLEALRFFVRIGGKETILSYGIDAADYARFDFPELMEAIQASVPRTHVEFLQGFEDLIVIGDYAFVHAGVQPNQTLASQRSKDLRWIRGEFLEHAKPLERIIIHGHTIAEEVEWKSHRIGIDTGAYMSGKLTALGIEGSTRWLIQTSGTQ